MYADEWSKRAARMRKEVGETEIAPRYPWPNDLCPIGKVTQNEESNNDQ